MPNVRRYLKQTLRLQRRARDAEGNPLLTRTGGITFDAAVNVRGRKFAKSGVVRTATGEEIEAESEAITGPETPVTVGDLIDGEEVRRVETRVDKGGRIIGYWSYL